MYFHSVAHIRIKFPSVGDERREIYLAMLNRDNARKTCFNHMKINERYAHSNVCSHLAI